jgi:hypothetical protein
MMQPNLQAAVQTMRPELQARRTVPMHVSLAFVEERVKVWLRFGRPVRETVLNRWRRIAVFEPGTVCCQVKWIANDRGTALWQLMVLQAPTSFDEAQRIAGVVPGARVLLRAEGELQVKAVLVVMDDMEALGIDPITVAVTYWRMIGNRLAARQPLPEYTPERHAAHIARGALQ